MLTLRNKYTFRNLSVLNVSAGPVCTLLPTALVFTFHLNCKYHPWGLINDMQMSIYNRKHWHALSHSLRPTRRWLATHPPYPASKSGSRFSLSWACPRSDWFPLPYYNTMNNNTQGWILYYFSMESEGLPGGVLGPFQNCPMFPCSHTFSLFVPLLINLLTTYYRPQFPPAKKKTPKTKLQFEWHHLKHLSEIHNPSEWDEH